MLVGLLASVIALQGSATSAPGTVTYHWQGGLQARWTECLNLDAAIVTSIQRLPHGPRMNPDHPDQVARDFDAERVRVISSVGLPSGPLTVVLMRGMRGLDPVEAMKPGTTYLLLVTKPLGGRLNEPNGFGNVARAICEAKADDEVLGVALFPTHMSTCSPGEKPLNRIVHSVVDCLNGADRQTARRACLFLRATSNVQIRWIDSQAYVNKKLAEYAESANDSYVKARIYRLLYDWHVLGSGDKFIQALIGCTTDADAFTVPDDDGALNCLSFADVDLAPGVEHKRPSPDDWIDAVAKGTNMPVVAFLLDNVGDIGGDDAHERKLVPLLDSPDENIRYLVARHFAALRDMKHCPQRIDRVRAPGYDYPDMPATVAWWKDYWKNK